MDAGILAPWETVPTVTTIPDENIRVRLAIDLTPGEIAARRRAFDAARAAVRVQREAADIERVADKRARWCVVRAAAGREQRLADAIREAGHGAFVPVGYRLVRASRHAKRRRHVAVMVLPGYVFMRLEPGVAWPDFRDDARFRDGWSGERFALGVLGYGTSEAARVAFVPYEEMCALLELHGSLRVHWTAAEMRLRAMGRGMAVRAVAGVMAGQDVRIDTVVDDAVTGEMQVKAIVSLLGRETVVMMRAEDFEDA